MDGSFKCVCQEGYVLSPSGHSCSGTSSEASRRGAWTIVDCPFVSAPPPSRFRRGRMFGEPAHLPERTLRERGRLVPMRLRGGLHRIGRRPVLRRHGRVRPERHVHQRQVHQHGRLVQVRLRRRLQTLVGRQNLLRYRPPTHLHSILIHNRASG